MYSNLTINSKSFITRFSHNARFDLSVKLIDPQPIDRILDFGTCDGYVLKKIREVSPNCKLTGYEPMMYDELKNNINDVDIEIINILHDSKYNKICCFEVLEHLVGDNQKKALEDMISHLEEGGKLIISVPIEIGIASFFKNIIRLAIGHIHDNTNIKTIIRSLFGLKIERGDSSYVGSHIGFDYRELEKLLLSYNLKTVKKVYSPIRWLGPINSQVFYVLSL